MSDKIEVKKDRSYLFQIGNNASDKYKEEYCDDIIKFFTEVEDNTLYKEYYDSNGNVKYREPIPQPPRLPTFERYATKLGVTMETLINWCKRHKRFKHSYARAKQIQLCVIKEYAANKQYDSNFAKFLCINNHDMADKTSQDLKFTDNSFEITISKDKAQKDTE